METQSNYSLPLPIVGSQELIKALPQLLSTAELGGAGNTSEVLSHPKTLSCLYVGDRGSVLFNSNNGRILQKLVILVTVVCYSHIISGSGNFQIAPGHKTNLLILKASLFSLPHTLSLPLCPSFFQLHLPVSLLFSSATTAIVA